jgi:tetratricopeptide (TPR) repeat protein
MALTFKTTRFSTWTIVLTTSVLIAMSSCSGSKAFVKRGMKMEEVGMMQQAANFYYTAVTKDAYNADALAGLQRAGQWVLNDHLARFDEARLAGNRGTAVSAFERAKAYQNKVERLGIGLLILSETEAAYNRVKNDHLEEVYEEAVAHLENEAFSESLRDFDEVLRLDPKYKDAKSLADIAYCEPLYRNGLKALEREHWRSAYNDFNACVGRDTNFKDAKVLREECLEKGQFAIALVNFENGSNRQGMETKLKSYVQQALGESQDPFLHLVDRENQELILQEQQLTLSGVIDANSSVEVGGLMGAKAILKGTVVSCDVNTSSRQRTDMQGFESYKVAKVNEDGKKVYETKYRPVIYQKYKQTREVKVTVQLSLVSLETGKTEMTEIIKREQNDVIEYARYGGDNNNIYPARSNGSLWRLGRRDLLEQLQADNNLRSEASMVDAAISEIANASRSRVEAEAKRMVQ